jgi:hypothetical protein
VKHIHRYQCETCATRAPLPKEMTRVLPSVKWTQKWAYENPKKTLLVLCFGAALAGYATITVLLGDGW